MKKFLPTSIFIFGSTLLCFFIAVNTEGYYAGEFHNHGLIEAFLLLILTLIVIYWIILFIYNRLYCCFLCYSFLERNIYLHILLKTISIVEITPEKGRARTIFIKLDGNKSYLFYRLSKKEIIKFLEKIEQIIIKQEKESESYGYRYAKISVYIDKELTLSWENEIPTPKN